MSRMSRSFFSSSICSLINQWSMISVFGSFSAFASS
jgi:hypothetical protein